MDMFVVRGGRRLSGRVAVGGAKNSALPIMAACLLADGPSLLRGVPDLVDVATLAELLRTLGMTVDRRADGSLALEVVDSEPCVAGYDLVRRMRAGVCVLGPLLARRGRACVSLPGGCNIGDRPIDLHLKGLRALGADVRVERGYVVAACDRLRGASIYLGGPFGSTVTGTCNVMTAAALADGVTTIEAAACEPEVVDVGRFLNALGAKIAGLGTPFLRIEGVERLTGATHAVIPDRIEAATLMIAAAVTHGRIELENVPLGCMTAVVEKLREIGVSVRTIGANGATVERSVALDDFSDPARPSLVEVSAPERLAPTDCVAIPYPGIPTDVQAQLMALLVRADGMSVVTDKVFPDRFMHAAELVRLGARIRREANCAIVAGVPRLSGACVMASDLRASAALVLAALAADGESVIRRIYHLDRGYESFEAKLNWLWREIRRVEDRPEHMPARFAISATGTDLLAAEPDAPHELAPPNWLKRRAGVAVPRSE